MVIAIEAIAAGVQRPDLDRDFAAAANDFFDPKRLALEFLWRRIEILDPQHKGLIGRSPYFSGLETMILDGQLDGHGFLRPPQAAPGGQDQSKHCCTREMITMAACLQHSTLLFLRC